MLSQGPQAPIVLRRNCDVRDTWIGGEAPEKKTGMMKVLEGCRECGPHIDTDVEVSCCIPRSGL